MREFDKETVRKIWQRVQSEQPVSEARRENGSLTEWIAWELSFGDVYRRLAGKMSGQTAGKLRRLARQEQQHAGLLRGICVMTEGVAPRVHPAFMEKAPVSVLLRQCYGEKLRAISQYEKRAADSQFGEVYRKILQEEQDQCRFLLQLLGQNIP